MSSLAEGTGVMQWFAVYTRSRHEQKVNGRLVKKEIETFLPMAERWSRRRDRRQKIRVPLFPGYLFVRVCLEPHVYIEILKTESVVRILGHNGTPTPIPDEEISAIQTVVRSGLTLTPFPYLKEGQRVRVVNGPLYGIEGILVETKAKKNRLVISVDLLKESASVEIASEDVEPI